MELLIDGAPATVADLAAQALAPYGASTSLRVEGGAVRGLDLHLARLEAAAVELFGEAVGEAPLRALMRQAAAGRAACGLRVSLFSNRISARDPDWTGRPQVMIAVSDPPPPPLAGPVRLQAQVYGREWPHLKHAATLGLLRARRTARAAGFDDALFTDEAGRIAEGSLWNIGFLRAGRVVWPQAPMLAGVGQALIGRGLEAVGLKAETEAVRLADLPGFDGAFLCNAATPACAIAAIDRRALAVDEALMARLVGAVEANPPQPI